MAYSFFNTINATTKKDDDEKNTTSYTSNDEDEEEEEESTSSTTVAEEEQPMTLVQNGNGSAITGETEEETQSTTDNRRFAVENIRSAYQENLASQTPDITETDTRSNYIKTLGQIGQIMKQDNAAGNEILNNFNLERLNSESEFYAPYSTYTNSAVEYLTQRGFDVNKINDETYRAYSGYLQYNGDTNTPSKPNKKKGTQEEWDAYYLYQYGKAVSDTDSVDKEWAAMQEEIAYWTNSGLNLSDQDIYDRVTSDENMKKYPTLRKLDESMSDPGKALMELNHGTDYSKDNIYGVIWSARNNGGTGDAMANTMLYSMGEGNQYVYDEKKAQKLNWNDKTTYSPYEVGMTLEDEGLYFGKDSFSNEDVEELRRTIDPNNPTDLKNYQAVAAANENTNKAEEQLANLNAEVDKWIQKGYSEERILKKVNDMLGDSDYNMLAAIDNSIENGTDLLKTTRPVNYKKSEFVQSITNRIAERNSVPTGDDALANISAPKTAEEIDREATILAEESKPEIKTEEIDTGVKGSVSEVPEGKKLSSPTDLEESEETSVQTKEENAEAVATGSNKTAQGTDLQKTESAPAQPETNVAGITEQEKKTAYDTVHGEGAYERDIKTAGDTNTPRVKTPQEIAEQNQNNRIIVVSDRLTGKMSDSEQQYFNAYPGIEGQRIADSYYNLKLDVIGETNETPTEQTSVLPEARVLIGRVATKQAVKADDNYISTTLGSLALRTDYEAKMKEAESVQAEIDAIDERYGTLMTAKKEIPQEVVITPVENLGLAVRYNLDENGEYQLDEVITVDADPIDSEAAHTAYLNSKGITNDELIENLIEDSKEGLARASEYANGVREARDKINETVEMMTLEDLDSGATLDVPYVSDGKGGYTLSPDFNSRSEEVQKYLEMTGETEDQLWQDINDQINYDLNTDPSQEEYNKLQARLESLNTYLAENNEAYNKANDELFTADAKRGRINDASIRLSGSGVDPLVADEVISVASKYQTSQVPATDHIGLIWELDDAYKFEEFSDAYREGLGATSTKCAEQAADLRGFVESYGNVIPDDIKSNMLAQADYYDSQSRLISDFLITKDENFQELATAGRNNHGLESRLTMEALGVGLDMMTSTEQDIFYALYEKDGKEAAVQFYDDIKGNLIQRANVSIEEGTKEFAESGIAGRAFNELFSIASAIPETFLSAGYLLESLIYGEGDDWLMTLSDAAKKANESTVNELKDIYQGTVWETVIPELTQMINNRGRSMAVGFTFGGLIPEGTSDIVHAFPISTIAFAEAYQDAKENGLEDWQAWSLGAVNFLCESVTEGIEFGHYDEAFKDGLSLKTFTEYFGDKIKGLDWLSEGTGETLNNVLERAFNRWIAGDKSEHNAKVQQYIDAGLADNEKDAQMLVMADYIKEDAHTFIVSALSSFMDLGTFVGGKLMSTVDYAIELQDYRRMGDETTTIKDLQNRDRQIYQAQQKAAETAEKNVAPAETVSKETATGENTTEETAVENQQEGTQEQEQQPQANPEMNPANVSAEIQEKQQIEYDTDLTILENADGTNQTSRTATVAAVMRVDARNLNRAGAAAVALTARDGDNTIGTLQTILDGGSKSGTNINSLKLGLQYAMLANGECRSVMESEAFQNAPSEEKAQMLARAALIDARSETVANEVKSAVHEFRVDEETKRLIANSETVDALDKSEDKVLEKKSVANAAKTNLENRQADEETKAQAAKEANELATNEPTPQNTDMAVHAVNEQAKAIEMTEQAKQTVANTTQEAQDAIDADDRLQQKTYDDIRQQAEANVFEMEQQEAADAAVAEQNRQAEERRQSEEKRQQMVADQRSGKTEEESVRAKIERLAADRGYTGDEAQKFVDEVYSFWDSGRFSNIDTTKQLSESESWLMMGALSRKFGVNVVISKDMNQNDNGSYNASTNTITLNGNLSAGQIMIDFALHEFTHSLEQTGAYTQYSDTVLGIMFGSEAELNDAITKKMSDYDANGHPIDEAQARRELVAEFTRTNLNDKETVYRMVDSGLGGRIRNFLHNINQFLKNQKLTGQDKIDAENLRKAERLFQKAINERVNTRKAQNGTEKQATEFSTNTVEAGNNYMSAVENGDMETAQQLVDQAGVENGYTIKAYHGTGRADRVGTVFLAERATSGPMAFFTDNREIAENYAHDKRDTSINYDEEYGDYHTQFRVTDKEGNSIPVSQLWNTLSYKGKQNVLENAKHITWDDEMENIIYDPEAKTGNGGFQEWELRRNKGNAIETLINAWLDGGDLYDQEERFLDVLKLAGIEDVTWNNPDYREEKVYDTYLNIQKPFEVESMFTNDFVDGLLSWWEEQDQDKYKKDSMGADFWDKNNRTVEEWADHARDNIEEGRTTVWTSIPDAVSDYLRSLGYDGIKDTGGKGGGMGHTVWIPFSSEQIKSAEPVTYDNSGNVIPLSERFNPENNDIRYSTGQDRQSELNQALIDAGISVQRSNTNTAYSSTNGQAQRQFGSQTAQQSNAFHQDVKDYLYTHSTYTPDTNNEQIDRAMGWVRSMASQDDPDGYNAALRKVSSDTFDYRSADGQARMLTVMSMAALKAENAETADARQAALNDELSLADAYNKQGTDLGRMLQARKIFRLMTPVGRQAVLLKMTDQINNEYAKEGKTTRVTLSDLTLRAAADAKTEEEFDNVRKAAASELAEQMPASWKEKLVAWRMLSMLGNVRTHVRNVLGNFAFVPVVGIKNKIGAVSEIIGGVEQGKRTKTLGLASQEARSFAKQDAVDMRQTLTGESKYNDGTLVQQERKAFGQGNSIFSKTIGKTVQAISDANSWALEAEDWVFLKGHYQRALAGYMTANNLTADDMKGQTLEKAREYAVNEAQKATYRDANELASKLSNFSKGSNNKALKTAQFVLNAVLPFKKTPANILRRGVEYSPAGLISSAFSLKNVKQYVDYQEGKLDTLPENAMSPTQWIDKFASGLTGTAVTALGYLLASKGIVKAGFDDDDEIDKLKGEQEYSLRFSIGDTDVSFTIDWAAPVCMPFFVGASIFSSDKAEAGDADDETIGKMVSDRISSLMHITEPVFNLSMLDGVSSLLNVSQSGDDTITQIAAKILANYGTSFVPTLSGQVARSVDTTRRQAYTQSGMNVLDRTFASAGEQVENKIPYLSKSNIPYRNAFGEADVNSQGWAIIENFISPGYGNVVNDNDPVLNELDRMYKSTGDKGMVPKMPQKYMTVDGEKINLTAEQYDQLTVERGQTAKTTLEKLFQTPEYLIADDATKADMISDVWTYANQVGHNSVDSGSSVDKWVESANKSDNAVSAIVDRAVERNKKDYATGHKESLIESINGNDLETALTDIEAIKEAGTSEQSIKTTLTNKFKPIYQEAIMSDDEEQWEKAESLMSMLEGLGIYSQKTLKSWNDIDFDEDEEEEEETDNSRWLSR